MDKNANPFLEQITHTCYKAFYFIGLFSFFINILMLTTALYMLQLYDRVLTSHSYDTLMYLTLIALIALFILALLDMVRSRILVRVSQWIDKMLSPAALRKSADEVLQGRPYGAQSLRDITNIRQFISGSGIFALFDAPWVPVYIVVIFMLHVALGLLATFGAIILFVIAILNETETRPILNEANARAIAAQSYVDASLRNAEVIQAMGMMPNIITHWKNKYNPVLQLQTMASNRAGILFAISKFLRLSLQILMLGLGAYLVLGDQLTGGAMIAASILLARALAPVEQSIGMWKQLLSARQAYQRLKKHFGEETRPTIDIQLPHPTGALSLENVVYRAPHRDKPVIYNVSMQANPGEIIALIGPSGAGKSTLARLIVGALKATAGNVRLDNAEVYFWDRKEFGRYVGYLPQDVELMSGTVKDNIARLDKVDDAAVITAAKLAGVHEMILHLPQGYDTMIGEGTFVLSGGQRQRIALARAVYKSPCLLVLDEPNSNLDREGDESLLQALLTMRNQGATQIIIAHRPNIVKFVDRIIVLSEGKIQYMGPREQVLAQLQEAAQRAQGQNKP